MKYYYIFLFCFGIIHLAISQSDFRPGYIIQHSGDTLRGEIDYRGDLLMGEICRFKTNSIITEYNANEIRSYRFENGKLFTSKVLENRRVFMEYLVNGEMDIYYRRDEEGDHYYVENANLELREIIYREDIRELDGKKYKYQSTNHMGLLNNYTEAAPGFERRVARLTKPKHRSLINLAEDYHEEVCGDLDDCIVYEKDIPWLRVDVVLTAGLFNIFNSYLKDNYSQRGLLLYFNLPRTNEKVFLKTGILHSRMPLEEGEMALYKFPLQLSYVYPKGILRPNLSFGFNVYRPIFTTTAFGGGLNVHLHKSVAITMNYETDYHMEFLIVPIIRATQSFTGGILISL